MRRGLIVLLYIAILVAEMSWAAVAPLLPSYADRFSLTDTQTGLILSVASLAILVISIPSGAIIRRIGARRLTVVSAVTMTAGNVGIGLAPNYGWLLAGRALFGLGLGMLWVGGTAWLHDAAGDRHARVLSMTSAVIGVGSLLGPAFAGVVGEHLGLGAPFLLLAVASVAVLLALMLESSGTAGTPDAEEPALRDMVRAAGGDDLIRSSVLLMLMGSLLWLTAELLIPLRLDAHGWSASDIGIVFSISSVIFAAVSWVVARRAERWATLGVAAAATAGLAASLMVVVVSASVGAAVMFLMLAGLATAVMIALTFPLGVAGSSHVSVAVIGGLLNMAWAISGLVGPTLGGIAAEVVGDRLTFLLLAIVTGAAALWMLRARRTIARRGSSGARDKSGITPTMRALP